jgi:hypothetical protein
MNSRSPGATPSSLRYLRGAGSIIQRVFGPFESNSGLFIPSTLGPEGPRQAVRPPNGGTSPITRKSPPSSRAMRSGFFSAWSGPLNASPPPSLNTEDSRASRPSNSRLTPIPD